MGKPGKKWLAKNRQFATKEDVGKIAVPSDNSYCTEMPSGIDATLSGHRVTILCRPFKLKVKLDKPRSRAVEREFVLVSYMGKLYKVMNIFFRVGCNNWIGSYEVVHSWEKNFGSPQRG